ncbi:hypothetical protein [Bartonella bovis]|uniref:hypothetical protein n=1 Tax=Bartonella bovis TaxID=155194 RepID=UPI0019597E31|nr:hypothetical protein [Bartonella bovis]
MLVKKDFELGYEEELENGICKIRLERNWKVRFLRSKLLNQNRQENLKSNRVVNKYKGKSHSLLNPCSQNCKNTI